MAIIHIPSGDDKINETPTASPSWEANGINIKVERNFKGFLRYLLFRHGDNTKFLMELAQSSAKFARKMKLGNARFKTALDVVEYGVPAVLMTSDLFAKVKEFDKLTKEKPNIYGEREQKIRMLLGLGDKDQERSIIGGPFMVGKDVCSWIARRPNTRNFIVEGFYKYDDLKTSQTLWDVERGDVFIVIAFEERKFVWQLSYVQYEEKLTINESVIYFVSQGSEPQRPTVRMPVRRVDEDAERCMVSGVLDRLKSSVFRDFLDHFDVNNNTICLNRGLTSRKRIMFKERVNQYNISGFIAEIRKVLTRGRKRGYAFVGIPGTGKSTIIRKLEDSIRDYPMVYVGADNMQYPHDIIETFRTISYMQPCIVVLEDLDSFDFDEKTERLGAFLDSIDDVNRNLNAIFIATINDTKLVHYTLINRPGRLDEVILVGPPSTAQEAYEVLEARFQKLIESDSSVKKEFPKLEEIDPKIFETIIGSNMTQADICEIAEKAVLLRDEVSDSSLHEAVAALLASKKAIKVCDFGGKSPYEKDFDGGKSILNKQDLSELQNLVSELNDSPADIGD